MMMRDGTTGAGGGGATLAGAGGGRGAGRGGNAGNEIDAAELIVHPT